MEKLYGMLIMCMTKCFKAVQARRGFHIAVTIIKDDLSEEFD